MKTNTVKQSIGRTLFIFLCAKMATFVKASFAIGSAYLFFSFSNSVAPLSGAFGGALGASFFFLLQAATAWWLKGAVSFSFIAYSGIPTLFAGLYWASESKKYRALVPIACMILFWLHPVGLQAWPYALVWLIPFAIAFNNKPSILFNSFASTFTAHAVGSVLWLYTTSMSSGYWYSLMPLVPLERTMFALGIVATHSLFSYIFALLIKPTKNNSVITSTQ